MRALLVASLVALPACGRIGYYPMEEQQGAAPPRDGGERAARDAGRADASVRRDAGVRPADASARPNDAARPRDAGIADGEARPRGSVCTDAPRVTGWAFDASVADWGYDPALTESVTWEPGDGHADAGALRIDTTSAPNGWVTLRAPLGDMRGRVGSVWVRLDSPLAIDTFVYLTGGGVYAQTGFTPLEPGEWTRIEFRFDVASEDGGFTASDVTAVGLKIQSPRPVSLLVDDMEVFCQ